MIKEISLEDLIDFIPETNNKNPNSLSDISDTTDPSDQLYSDYKENPVSISVFKVSFRQRQCPGNHNQYVKTV